MLSDISERKRAEEALRASEARHRTLFQNSPDALLTLGAPDWGFTSCNAASIGRRRCGVAGAGRLRGISERAARSRKALASVTTDRASFDTWQSSKVFLCRHEGVRF